MKNIAKNIPNAITCCNLISGCIAIVNAFMGNVELALMWIVIGATFDFFDGMSARLLKVSSPIGKELDSLADVVTFGIAPSTMIFYELSIVSYPSFSQSSQLFGLPLSSLIPYLAYLMAAFSALRLAKFNIDTRQSESFIGLPTPANALFWGSLIVTNPLWLEAHPYSFLMILTFMLFSSFLLVSEIPMFALKFKHWGWRVNKIRYSFMILTVMTLAIFGLLKGWWIVILYYFCISLILWYFKKEK